MTTAEIAASLDHLENPRRNAEGRTSVVRPSSCSPPCPSLHHDHLDVALALEHVDANVRSVTLQVQVNARFADT